jgi:hypothetical protein
MRALPLIASLLALLTLAAPAAAQDVARLDRPTPLSAHDGWLAWSARGADGQFHLTLRDPDGIVTTPVIAGRATSFDVDLGPGPDGLAATYSRCRVEVGSAGSYLPADYDEGEDCDVYLYDVASGAERRVAGASTATADETWPTVWRDRIAFVRSYDSKPTLPYMYARPLAGGRSERQPGGTRNVCTRTGRRVSCTAERVSRPYALDLYGRRLAFGWTYAGRSEGLDTEIRLDTLGGGHARVAYQRGGGLTGRALGWPSFESGRVYFSEACYADTGGCIRQPELQRYRISTRTTEGADADKAILSHERDSGVDWLLIEEASGTDCQGDPAVAGGTCVLRGVRPAYR